MQLVVQIVRYISHEPQPGIVACEFADAENRIHTLIDKVPIFSVNHLDETDSYPQSGCVRCEVSSTWRDEEGHELAKITTNRDGVESTEGLSEFVVLTKQLG
jgi:hypothetical protein